MPNLFWFCNYGSLFVFVFRHPDDIDLFAGGISERAAPGALVGPTFQCIIGYQFMLFKMGDRFFYENKFPTGFTPGIKLTVSIFIFIR